MNRRPRRFVVGSVLLALVALAVAARPFATAVPRLAVGRLQYEGDDW